MKKLERFWYYLHNELTVLQMIDDQLTHAEIEEKKILFLLKYLTFQDFIREHNKQNKQYYTYRLVSGIITSFVAMERKNIIDDLL